ncbi:hypothetical protein, partial [Candidatus Venteria ishoeyi]
PYLVYEPFNTKEAFLHWIAHEGWPTLSEVLNCYGQQLPLPSNCHVWQDIFPANLRYRLDLQACFSEFSGIGSTDELSLLNEIEQERIEWFIRMLRQHRAALRYFDLTLNRLLERLLLPGAEETQFRLLFCQQLHITDTEQSLLDFL